ncbi:MAG: 3'(2'),5'-bisphosphate nucleotidase CysQ [Rickettsiales bacterium]|nr:3'(2'),5'-bisphosphate nucleotidase CysQ [Rickettsiales bacterium]
MSFFIQSQIDKIIAFTFEAGEIARNYQKSRDFVVTRKPDNTQVTSADIAVSKFLNQKLSQEFPQIPIICEEGDLREISGEIFWLIDPIDGTSSFIKGSDEFAINIALIKNGKPIFGALYGPRFEGGKMAVINADDKVVIIDQDRHIKPLSDILLATKNDDSKLKIITSNKTHNDEITKYIAQFHPNYIDNFTIKHQASAVKFFPILENQADLYIAFRKMMEWDTAAGHALVDFAGGKLKNLTLQNSLYVIDGDLRYKKPNFTNEFFACYKASFN